MNAAARKSFELQAQVRHNAEIYRNELKDLHTWQQEAKKLDESLTQGDVECAKESEQTEVHVQTHVEDNKTKLEEIVLSPEQLKHQQANEIKNKGNDFVKEGQYDKGMEQYSAAIALYAKDAFYYTNRALCYLKLEKFKECIQDCETAIEIDKMFVKAYYRRMQANEALGNILDALHDCTVILCMDPKNSEAKRSLERINNRLRQNALTVNGASFTPVRSDLHDILPIDKPAYKRSTKPMRRVPVAEIEGPKDNKNYHNQNLKISDEDIDRLFNSNCGPFEEVKKQTTTTAITTKTPTTKDAKLNEKTTTNNISTAVTATTNRSATVAPHNAELDTTSTANADSNKISENSAASADKSSTTNKVIQPSSNNSKPMRALPSAPTCSAQFYSQWKELLPEQKYRYLKSINISQLNNILGAGFDSDTFTEIINTLLDFYVPHKEPDLTKTLQEISKNKQVNILSLLMSQNDKKACSEILNYLKEQNVNDEILQTIAKDFNLD